MPKIYGVHSARIVAVTIAGWVLLVLGIVAIPLPGPGVLITFAGLAILARRYHWARRVVAPVRRNALHGASKGVQSWWRICVTLAGIACILGAGVLWFVRPEPPAWWPADEHWWLVGGPGAGIAMLVSATALFGLLVYSFVVYRSNPFDPEADKAARQTAIETQTSIDHPDSERVGQGG